MVTLKKLQREDWRLRSLPNPRRQATISCGGHRWSVVVEEEVGVLGEKRGEKCVFYTVEHICNLQDSPR